MMLMAPNQQTNKGMEETHPPANQEELSGHAQPPHGHQQASDRHALAEAHHHAGLRQPLPKLPQQPVEVPLARVAVDLV